MPPIGGRNTSRSGRVTSSGIHAAGLLEQRAAQLRLRSTPKRSAMPGRYQTGSTAALVTATSPVSLHDLAVDLEPAGRDRLVDLRHGQPRLGDRDASGGCRRPRAISWRKSSATRWPHGSSETIFPGSRPLRERADLDDRRGVGEVRPRDRARARRTRPRARDRAHRSRHARRWRCGRRRRCTVPMHRPALARARRAPGDRKAGRHAAAPRMRGEPDMAPNGCSSSSSSRGRRRPKSEKPPARHVPNERPQIGRNIGQKARKIKLLRRQRARGPA